MKSINPKNKVILHIDGDAFFVGVEVAKNPKLKGLPVVTGEEKGIASALSYEAKALGVVRGMPIFRIKKEFPSVVILPGDYKSYALYSRRMFEIVNRYAYGVEEYSIDECFADITGLDRTLKITYREIAEKIKKEINEELRLSVSIGLAPTKVLAKIASNWVKPNGLTIIDIENAPEFLTKVPIQKVWGIGKQTADVLIRRGVKTALDFRNQNLVWVKQCLSKPYEVIWAELNGSYLMSVDTEIKDSYSSIQKTRTFHPSTNDRAFLWSQLSKHIEDACKKARYYKLTPKKISIFLKTSNFKIVDATETFSHPSNSPEIALSSARALFEKIYKKGELYRTAGIVLLDLDQNFVPQRDLFGGTTKGDKFDEIHKQIDTMETKFGKKVVHLASTQNALKRRNIGTDTDDLERNLLFL